MIVFFYPTVFTSEMWKNIFIESCLLSALIFGGFYIQSNIIKREINSSDRAIQEKLMHISGGIYPELIVTNEHLSGVKQNFQPGTCLGKSNF